MTPEVLKAISPWYAVDFFLRDGLAGVPHPRRGRAGRHRRRGLVRRHGTLRPAADPADLVQPWCFPALAHQLLRAGGAAARGSLRPGQSVLLTWLPGWALYPMVGIATAAAIVASQALISGAFSLTRQAVQLGYIPRVTIVHTSSTQIGPDLHPGGELGPLARLPRARGRLPAARATWRPPTVWRSPARCSRRPCCSTPSPATGGTGPAGGPGRSRRLLLLVDVAFFSANIIKIEEGGWFPIVVGLGVYLLMTTWNRGRARLQAIVQENTLGMDLFLADVGAPAATAGPRHRGLPHPGHRRRAAGAAAPPQAQQGAAREGDAHVGGDRGDPLGGRGGPGASARSWGRDSTR